MGFVKTAEEMDAIAAAQSRSLFHSENIFMVVESDAEYLNSVVPDPLKVTDPYFTIVATKTQTFCVGDAAGVVVYVPASYEGVVGQYMLCIYYGPEAAIQWGRDLVGEPKKSASIGFHRFGAQRRAYADRYGTRIVNMEATVDEQRDPSSTVGIVWTVRSLLAPDWRSLDGKASLLATHIQGDIHEEYVGTGTLELNSTPHDPMADLPVHGILTAGGRESTFREVKREVVAEIDPDYYVPFFYGQHVDDWSKMTPGATMLSW